jgi:hypothetical protein
VATFLPLPKANNKAFTPHIEANNKAFILHIQANNKAFICNQSRQEKESYKETCDIKDG